MEANEYVRDLLEKSDYPNDLRYEAMEIENYLFITWCFNDYYDSHYKSEVHKKTPDGWVEIQTRLFHTGES